MGQYVSDISNAELAYYLRVIANPVTVGTNPQLYRLYETNLSPLEKELLREAARRLESQTTHPLIPIGPG